MQTVAVEDVKKPCLRLVVGLAAAGAALFLGACASKPAQPGQVTGRLIAALGDADMSASAFSSNELGERDPDAKDTLTIVALPIQEPVTPHAQVEVSNSALGPSAALAVTADGKYAFVAEYRGPAPAGATTVDQLPKGKNLAAIDLTDPLNPRVSGNIYVGSEPAAVAVHPSGDLVAVVTGQPRQQIVMVNFRDGEFTDDPWAWSLIGLDNDEGRASNVAWHPAGRAFAVTLQDRGEVAFYHFKRESDGAMAIQPWSEPVKIGRHPHTGVFTPDGRYFVVSDFRAGPDSPEAGDDAMQGQIGVIRLGDMPGGLDSSSGGPAGHIVLSYAPVGVRPIGLALSHDGRYVVTANLKTSTLPESDPRVAAGQPRGGSVSLLALSADGALTSLGEFPINAVPAGIAFDAEDRFVGVTQFRSFDPSAIDGEIAFFQLKGHGSGTRLEPCDFFVGVGKGPHGMLIIR